MSMSNKLPAAPLLSAYWLNSELTNTFPCPTLRNVLCYTKRDGSPQIGVVYLVGAAFAGTPTSFQPPYLTFAPSLLNMLENGNIGLLQQAGIKVLLCIQGSNTPTSNMGWSTLSDGQSKSFASWLQNNVIQKYGLDGVDIDDEFSSAPGSSQQLVNTVAWVRNALPNSLITKALWNDTVAFTLPATSSPLAGQKLAALLNFGSTMGYGWSVQEYESQAATYASLGMTYDKLCLGIQPGPEGQPWMTSLTTTKTLAGWTKQNGLLGMMMWSFSQDIAEFTTSPQYSVPYLSATDHQWQKTIITTWGSAADCVVNTPGLRSIYYPEGSFWWTSTDVQMVLRAELQDSSGTKWVPATVNIVNYDNADLINSNGAFVKSETMLSPGDMASIKAKIASDGLGDFVPVGSYYKTARNVTVSLVAQCKTIAGTYVQSTLDLSKANYATTIVENTNGVLTLRSLVPPI